MMSQNIFDDPVFFDKYMDLRKSSLSHNELIEKPSIYSILPTLQNKRILDIGCGYGDFTAYAIDNNCREIIGIDLSLNMIELAMNKCNSSNCRFVNDDILHFEYEKNSFDLIFSSLTLHYVSDIRKLFKKVYGWLNEGCEFIFSIEHPINTASPNSWILDEYGNKKGWDLKNYDIEGLRIFDWLVENVEKYHKKISTYIADSLSSGFSIDKILEPEITDEILKKNSRLVYEKIRPPYLIFKLVKK